MRKFYRSSKNKYLSGVCGGLGYHTKVDPILWRVFMVMLGPGVIILKTTYCQARLLS